MTFKNVIIKNFKGSFKKYYAYFLSVSFSVMIFFMYTALFSNKEIAGRNDTQVINYVFPVTMVAIVLFSVFFINYAHSAFVKGKNKEFGVYMSLGMNSKELNKLINMENLMISGASFIVGTAAGTLFSRLFQMIILALLDISNIHFYLDYKPYLFTALMFILIFASVNAITYLRMKKIDIAALLKEARKSEGRSYGKKDLIFGSLGLMIMAGSVVFLVIIAGKDSLNSNPALLMGYMITAFSGVYLALSYGGNLILHLLKKSRRYYKNLLSITEIHYRFDQNRKIIFVLSVLSTMTLFLVASSFSLFRLSEKLAEMSMNDLVYVETKDINNLSPDVLKEITGNKNVSNYTKVKFIFLSTRKDSNSLSECKPVISADEYNALTKSSLVVPEGCAVNIIIDWTPGNHGIEQGKTYSYYTDSHTYQFQFTASQRGDWIAAMQTFPSDSVIVINSADYNRISAEITDANTGYYHLINFKNWKKSREVVTDLESKLGDSGLKAASLIENYKGLKREYSVFLFVCTVLGILFFTAGGSVLYFKQFTELSESKAAFYKLYKIGITDKEMKGIIGKELAVVFFLPLVFGAFLGISMIYLTTNIFGGDAIIKEFLTNVSAVVIVYFISQGIFYLITKNRYIQEIVKLV